ncbi:hypothetical protein H8356DRAFT_1340014 [Neocallimastix lanati (nom. inval.)]|nr:hypothetical protein H8356DRAFT_1340014 [Neocallimastix sp. JGI-2020a]
MEMLKFGEIKYIKGGNLIISYLIGKGLVFLCKVNYNGRDPEIIDIDYLKEPKKFVKEENLMPTTLFPFSTFLVKSFTLLELVTFDMLSNEFSIRHGARQGCPGIFADDIIRIASKPTYIFTLVCILSLKESVYNIYLGVPFSNDFFLEPIITYMNTKIQTKTILRISHKLYSISLSCHVVLGRKNHWCSTRKLRKRISLNSKNVIESILLVTNINITISSSLELLFKSADVVPIWQRNSAVRSPVNSHQYTLTNNTIPNTELIVYLTGNHIATHRIRNLEGEGSLSPCESQQNYLKRMATTLPYLDTITREKEKEKLQSYYLYFTPRDNHVVDRPRVLSKNSTLSRQIRLKANCPKRCPYGYIEKLNMNNIESGTDSDSSNEEYNINNNNNNRNNIISNRNISDNENNIVNRSIGEKLCYY